MTTMRAEVAERFPSQQTAASNDRRHYGLHAVWGADGRLVDAMGMSAIPPRCPYKAGDWVVFHGFAGAPPWWRVGWRGFVLGYMGSTILRGLTDDGLEWAEHWGHIDRDGVHDCNGPWCTCCPHRPRRPQRRKPEQLALFDLLGGVVL